MMYIAELLALYLLYFYLKDTYWTMLALYLLYFYLKDVQQNAVLNHVSIATYCISTWKMYSKMQYWTMLALLLIVFLLERCTAKCSTEPC